MWCHSEKKLIDKINNSKIKCISSSKDRYKRFLATCFKDKINLNKWMVRNGNAVAYKRYSKDYVRDEEYAKENKLGLWTMKFLYPWEWRAKIRKFRKKLRRKLDNLEKINSNIKFN